MGEKLCFRGKAPAGYKEQVEPYIEDIYDIIVEETKKSDDRTDKTIFRQVTSLFHKKAQNEVPAIREWHITKFRSVVAQLLAKKRKGLREADEKAKTKIVPLKSKVKFIQTALLF